MPVHFDGSILALKKSKAWIHITAGDIVLVYPLLSLQHLILVALLSLSQHRCPSYIWWYPISTPTLLAVYESFKYLISTHHFHSAVTLVPFISASYMKANGGSQFWLLRSSLPLKASNCPFRLLRHCSWAAQSLLPMMNIFCTSPLWLRNPCYLRRRCPFISMAPSSPYRKAKREFTWQQATLV